MTTSNADFMRWKEEKRKFPVFDLPYDIRCYVFKHVVAEVPRMAVFLPSSNYFGAGTGISLPKATQAKNRLLRQETILAALKHNVVEIHSGPGNDRLQDWLTTLTFPLVKHTRCTNGFDAIHRLCFPYFSRLPHQSLPLGRLIQTSSS
jgi:hypothetical protein